MHGPKVRQQPPSSLRITQCSVKETELDGDYSTVLTMGSGSINSVETLQLTAGHSYSLFLSSNAVGGNQTTTVAASTLGASDNLSFNASNINNSTVAFIMVKACRRASL